MQNECLRKLPLKSNQINPEWLLKALKWKMFFQKRFEKVILKTLIKGTRLKSGQAPSVQPFSLGSIVDIHIS